MTTIIVTSIICATILCVCIINTFGGKRK